MDITAQLRSAILEGKYPPGTLLSQTDLAREYAVSRIPIRDALLGLAADKLIEVLPGKGARVVTLSTKELEEVFELRIMLECDLLRRAVLNAGEEAKSEVLYVLKRSSLEAGRPGWQKGDWDFHRALYSAADRPRQLALVDELRKICVVQACKYTVLAAETERWLHDHEAIVEAYVGGCADEASALLTNHLRASLDKLLSLTRELDKDS
ncbi:GntR family transcriptional regulator [Agrobacterium vitis]|uniref:GntR family transcriptional regulator n=1 Tax=Agrobacterium vitis TaxID=373 RepID=A0AAE2RCZ0_AGRVI|nr:GntR family transcriptional regulator [Agrobacterium vitis]MBF2716215.1 GntR family transcriptional regulator [Agrobacterium vitis]